MKKDEEALEEHGESGCLVVRTTVYWTKILLPASGGFVVGELVEMKLARPVVENAF